MIQNHTKRKLTLIPLEKCPERSHGQLTLVCHPCSDIDDETSERFSAPKLFADESFWDTFLHLLLPRTNGTFGGYTIVNTAVKNEM